MASLDIHRNGFVLRSTTNKPPKHHTMKIVSFSRLKSVDRYESTEFKAGGYKWKLVLFPNGNKTRGVDDHLSLYLEMCGDKGVDPGCIVTVDYKFFLFNWHWKNYLVLEDAKKEVNKYCVYKTIIGGLAGFDRFIPFEDFSDASNGYLVDDTCRFGAEVFVSKRKRKGAGDLRKYVNLDTVMCKHVWTIPNFSKLYAEFAKKYKSNNSCLCSKPFTTGGQKYCKWVLVLYSNELNDANYFSLNLELFEPETYLPTGSKVLAEVTVCILDQIHHEGHYCFQGEEWFSDPYWSYGAWNFTTHQALGRLLKNDSCIITAEIIIREIIIP